MRNTLLAALLGAALPTTGPQLFIRPAQAQNAPAALGNFADVTAAVRGRLANNALSVLAETALAGIDPAHKTVKRLVVVYNVGGDDLVTAVMESQTLKILAPAGQKLVIKRALYGDVAYPLVDVTPSVNAAVKNGKLPLTVHANLAGAVAGQPPRDPAPGKAKKLWLQYMQHTAGGKVPAFVTLDDGAKLAPPLPGQNGALEILSAIYGDLETKVDAKTLLAAVASAPAAPNNEVKIENNAAPRLPRPKLLVTPLAPTKFEKRGAIYFADFGKAAYGNLQITFPGDVAAGAVTVRLGEKLAADGSIERKPPGSVNYREIPLTTQAGQTVYKLQIPGKERHKNPAAVHTPESIGEVTVFRYVEIENSPAPLEAASLRHLFVHTAFDDNAGTFQSSDATLNAVWDICKYTMKATTAFGVYIDGERERIPYEADAYINQLSHYAVDLNPEVARHTVEHLLAHPTWPTEWSLHMPMMAAADYEATGDISLTVNNYEALKKKLLMEKAREDGLIKAGAIVDWPGGERDGYGDGVAATDNRQQVGPMINTVANAFYFHALKQMALLARAAHKEDDAKLFEGKAAQVYQAFNAKFWDAARGVYTDGEGSNHASLHGNMFALAFDLVPAERNKSVADFVQGRGMKCSVYGAQYLLEALYKAGRDDYALQLMTAKSERSWWHMIELGSTMTLEAWDAKFKPNLTWNHAWGSVPGNIIARYLVGVRPLEPGYKKILVAPRPGSLQAAQAKVPTPLGAVQVNFENNAKRVEITVPQGATARVSLLGKTVTMNKKPVAAQAENGAVVIDNVAPGRHVFEVQ